MLNHQTIKRILRTWRITKVMLGVLSLVGAGWAVRMIFLKNHPVHFEAAFPVPGEGGGKETEPQPKPEPKVRLLSDRPRSPEVNAVLARVSPVRPSVSSSETEPANPVAEPVPAPKPLVPAGKPKGTTQDQLGNVELPVSIQPLEAEAAEVKQVREVFERYRKTSGWWDRMSMVRSPGRTSGLAHRYYDEQSRVDPVTDKLIGATRFTMGEESFIQLAFVSNSRWSNTARVNFTLPDNGEPLIDWESFVGYGDQTWDKFVASRSDQPTLMRGYIAVDDYYNFEFTDRDRYLSTKLTSPDGKITVFGYCDRHSTEGDAVTKMTNQLATMLLDGPLPVTGLGPTIPVVVEIAFPAKAQSDKCVNIHRIISNRWVLTNAEQAELVESLKARAKPVKSTIVEK